MDSAKDLTPIDIPLKDIFCDPSFNCRGNISNLDVQDLLEDIQKRGLQTPVTVMEYNQDSYKYRLLSGFRRFKCFQLEKRETIPAKVKTGITETDAIVENLAENIKRANLNQVQEAHALFKLKVEGNNINEIAVATGMSISWVNLRLKILELPEEIQQDVIDGVIGSTDIIKMSGMSVQQQFEYVKSVKDKLLFGRIKIKGPKGSAVKERSRKEINELQNTIFDLLGPSFITRCLSWAQGEISDMEVHKDLQNYAAEQGVDYFIPMQYR